MPRAESRRERSVEVGPEPRVRPVGGARQRPDDEQAARRQVIQPVPDEVPQPAAHRVTDDGAAHGPGHDEPGASWPASRLPTGSDRARDHRLVVGIGGKQVNDDRTAGRTPARTHRRAEVTAAPQSLRRREHG